MCRRPTPCAPSTQRINRLLTKMMSNVYNRHSVNCTNLLIVVYLTVYMLPPSQTVDQPVRLVIHSSWQLLDIACCKLACVFASHYTLIET